MARSKTLLQKMTDVTPIYVARFIKWYYTPEDKRPTFDEFKREDHNITNYDTCMEWLQREDGQEALHIYMKHMKKFNLMKLYEVMLNKALTGDVNSAKWVESFSNSEFFDESDDEIDEFMDSVNIPALKSGDKNGTK